METDAPQPKLTQSESLELVLCFIRSICYLRGLFPEDEFTSRKLPALESESTFTNFRSSGRRIDMRVQILLPRTPETRRLIDWIEIGITDALRKQYMQDLFFGISEDLEGRRLIEEYQFSIAYSTDMSGCKIRTSIRGKKRASSELKDIDGASVRNELCKMMRTLVTISQLLDEVPEKHFLYMKMTYYDHCPEEYQPPFFIARDPEKHGSFPHDPFQQTIGNMKTQHHRINFRCQTILEGTDDALEEESCPSSKRVADSKRNNSMTPVVLKEENIRGKRRASDVEQVQTNSVAATKSKSRPTPGPSLLVRPRSFRKIKRRTKDTLFEEVKETCAGKSEIKFEDIKLAILDASEQEIMNCIDRMIDSKFFNRTSDPNTFQISDLKGPLLQMKTQHDNAAQESTPLLPKDDLFTLGTEIAQTEDDSVRGIKSTVASSSERTSLSMVSQESNENCRQKTIKVTSSLFSALTLSNGKSKQEPVISTGNEVDSKSAGNRKRKASFVDIPITNSRVAKKARVRKVSRMRSMRAY